MKPRTVTIRVVVPRRRWVWWAAIAVAAFTLTGGIWFGYGAYPGYDSDGDGLPDWLEQLLGLDYLSQNDADGDVDGDGILNKDDTSYGSLPIRTWYPVQGERLP